MKNTISDSLKQPKKRENVQPNILFNNDWLFVLYVKIKAGKYAYFSIKHSQFFE